MVRVIGINKSTITARLRRWREAFESGDRGPEGQRTGWSVEHRSRKDFRGGSSSFSKVDSTHPRTSGCTAAEAGVRGSQAASAPVPL